ncbi:MAG: NUDIX hydrolase [Proteobacteria bacterium]|nr:NUDIX hydrolase [Pseudomonadota bacterium]
MIEDADEPVRIAFEGKFLRMCVRGRWEYVERTHAGGMATIILAHTPDRRILFVEQYRVPLGKTTIEFPAGLVGDLDAGESLELSAARELEEETGWRPAHCEVLLIGPTSSGLTNERVAFVRASGLTKIHAGGGDATENIVVHAIPHDEAPRWLVGKLAEGRELDLKLWAGLWLLDRQLDGSPLKVPG